MARKVGSLPRTKIMGASGASRGCPTRDSEESSGGNFSAFAVGGDCTPKLAVKTDILVTWRFMRSKRPVRRSGGVGTTPTRPKMPKVEGKAADRGKE